MTDPIERQDAIDALEKIPVREFKKFDDGLLDALISIGQVYMALKRLPSAQTDPDTDLESLSSGVWDAKELPTTQPDKIEVHLQEPYALMIKEVIVKETTYRMATKQETVGELTRCKDCKHYKTHISCIGDEYSGCDYWINDGNESPCEPTDFCSYAERRNDEVD